MSLENLKITSEQISENGVVSAPDKLTGNAAENKAVFDNLIRVVVSEAINKLIDVLTSPEAAASLGAKWPEGESANSLQEALDAAVVNSDEALEKAKEALDAANAASGADLSNYVKKTDIAELGGAPGLAKLFTDTTYGLGIKNGYLAVTGATENLIRGKGSANAPITPKVLDYAIIRGIAYNEYINGITNDEQNSALTWLGGARIHEGQYQGAGENQSNPSKIPCPFRPKLVIIISVWAQSTNKYKNLRIMTANGKYTVGENSNSNVALSNAMSGFDYTDGFVSWYDTSGVYEQCSVNGVVYRFVCVG